MNWLAFYVRMILKSMASGFLALLLPLVIVGGWIYAELHWMEQPPDSSDSHIKGGAHVLLFFPRMWMFASVWFLILWLLKQYNFRKALLLTMLPALLLPASLAYLLVASDAPLYLTLTFVGISLAVATIGATLSAWGWSKLNATWPN